MDGRLGDDTERFQDWYRSCNHQDGCRIYAISQPASDPSATKLMEVTENGLILFTSIINERDHYRTVGMKLPVYVILDGISYVRSTNFAVEGNPGIMQVDGHHITDLSVVDESHFMVPEEKFLTTIEALKRGRHAVISYVSPPDITARSTFSAIGFTRAFQSLESQASVALQ